MKKQFIAALAMAASMSAFAQGTIATQEGFALTREWSIDVAVANPTNHRSGIGINDKFYVNEHSTGILVYDKEGNLLKTIAPTEGYHNWISCNVDAAGHLLAQLDVKAFDGTCSPNGSHGFMVIDTKTDEVAKDFLPMTFGYGQRFDAMAPVDQNILTDYNTRILSVLNAAVSSYQFSYNAMDKASGDIPEYGFWKVAAFNSSANLDVFCQGATAQTSTGYAMQYKVPEGNPEAAMLVNPYFSGSGQRGTFSGPGMCGNGIRKYTGNWTASEDYFYTPMHAGITGFNLFYLDGKQYIVYPTICLQSNGNYVNPADAIAIAEVSFVKSPATDMTMEGEALVEGLPVGVVKAVVMPEMSGEFPKYTAQTACPPSYTIESVEGDEKSVYIYMYNAGAPCVKYKFSVGVEPAPELPGTGEGTLESPYDVARVLGLIDAELNDENAEVYVSGVIKAITEVSTSYGNATYSIKDADAENSFGIYRGYYLNNEKFTAADQIAVNDTVVVCGKVVNYKGNTPQMTSGNYIVSIKKAPVEVVPGPDFSSCTGTAEATVAATEFNGKVPGQLIVGEGDAIYGFDVQKAEGQTAPAYNANAGAVRLYANNTMTVYGGKLTSIEFVLDQKNQGKRYCPVTASTGEIATQAVGDTCVVWTGDATEVTFTVGALAEFGTENTKPGQIHFLELVINAPAEVEPEPEPAVTATLGSVATQEGYILEALWTADEISVAGTTNRSGVGVNDKFYVNYYGEGVRVYSNTGKLLKTIPATEGYHNWVSCNVDQEGYVYVQLDVKAFDGTCSTDGNHGFMVIDSKTDEVVVPFLPMTFGYAARFDVMSPIQGSVFDTEKLGIWSVVNTGTSTYRFLYNAVGAEKPSYWTTKTCATGAQVVEDTECKSAITNEVVKYPSLFPKDAAKQTSTGYAMQYTLQGDENFSIFAYANPVYNVTYSAAGMYGNGIHKFTAGYANTEDWVYTPQHSGLTAFNFFNIGGKDYVIYPAGLTNVSADAFAIAEVSYVNSPATDMDMVGETLVEGKPVGALKARVFAALNEAGTTALYAGNPSTAPSYNVVPVDGDEKSVYIYVYSNGAPGVKYKFTADPQDGIADVIGAEGEGEAVYYNLQGIRVANPANGIYIMRQGNKVSKVIR